MRLIVGNRLLTLAVATVAFAVVFSASAEDKLLGKQRRIILNDDSEPVFHAKNPEEFLAKRFKQATATQVGTYIIYVGDGWHPHRGREFASGLGDPYRTIIDTAHSANVEIFASLRMNDVHCSWDGTLSPLQRSRPDLLIGDFSPHQYPNIIQNEKALPRGGYPLSLMQAFWTSLNYAKPEVRELRCSRIEKVARAYDFDGFELDFMRAPMFFKPGEVQENLSAMNEFVRQIRQTLNNVGEKRGRRYLLAVRIPDTSEMALRTGLDVKTWLDEHLVDMLMVGGGYMPFSDRVKELIDIAHTYQTPAYPVVDIDGWYSEEEKVYKNAPPHACAFDSHCEPAKVRAIASNFWSLGADGVYLFNWYGLPADAIEQLELLNQIGDVSTLKNTTKQFQPDNGLDDWVTYAGFVRAPRRFPVRLIDGTPIEVLVGDDLAEAAQKGKLDLIKLRVEMAKLHADEKIGVSINDMTLPSSAIERISSGKFEIDAGKSPWKKGVNRIVILPGKGSIGRVASEITWLDLIIQYR